MNYNKTTKQKILSVSWKILLFIFFNSASIAFLVLNLVDIKLNIGDQVISISYWNIIEDASWKSILIAASPNNELLLEALNKYNYEWYHKFLVYLFMVIGWVLTFIGIKFFYEQRLADIRAFKSAAIGNPSLTNPNTFNPNRKKELNRLQKKLDNGETLTTKEQNFLNGGG